ncbi:hypothetical protein [Rhizobacter sp. Root1221]|uniref:hypothetical protein n=1 Tax=Rhizobacter sp. Root1221 TaxID=1736433 RepID=UPI000A6A5AB3|nr:hypothetical protein [Rhizobacter sp. Root1221]
MSVPEICPKCFSDFSARKALLSGGVRFGYSAFSDKGPAVRCPNCWHVFPSRNLRLFGFLPTDSLRWVVLGILAACFILSFLLKRHAS